MSCSQFLFDVMKTLVHEPFPEAMLEFFEMSYDDFIAAKHPTAWIAFEKGEITEDEYFERFFTDGRCIDGSGLRAHIRKTYRWIDGMEAILAELKTRGYGLHALTNYPIWYKMIEESLGISRYVAWTFVSCHTGSRKPEPRAYLDAARSLGVRPAQCVFIDDRQKNVDAARELEMTAILFTNAQELRKELVALNLL
jgi:HAD superfamily hydrolase (TIGR01509 family)